MSDYNAKCKNSLPIIFDDNMPVTNLTPKIVNRVNNNTEDLKNLYNETESQAEDIETLQEDLEGKIDVPQTAGTSGQVLTSDGEGGVVWAKVGAGEIVVDPTLTVEGAAADAKVTGGEITAIKTDLSELSEATTTEWHETVTEDLSTTWVDGYVTPSGNSSGTSDTLHKTGMLAVNVGEVFKFDNTNFKFRYAAAYDSSKNIVSASGADTVNTYTVPSGISYVILTKYKTTTAAVRYTHDIVHYKNSLLDDVTAIQSDIEEALYDEDILSVTYETPTWTVGKYKPANGGIATASGLNYSSEIQVSEGDVLFYANDNYKFRFVCALDADGNAIQAKGSDTELKNYTVPAGIASVIVSVYDVAMNSGTNILHITNPTEKRAKTVQYGNGSILVLADSMTTGGQLFLPKNNCKIGSRYQFSCKVSEFGSIEFAMGTTHVVVDDTNIIFKYETTTQAAVPHGLTIGTEFLLVLQNETSIRPSYVSVSSLGNRFEYNGSPNITFLLDNGTPSIKCVEGTLTNCAFSFTSSHIFKPVWIFGDSYLSWYDTRWTYYAAEDGNTENVFFSGYAGENSQASFGALVEEIKLAKPKILVWCLGMNDPDSESAVNPSWYLIYQQVESMCKEYGIELVLYTTPTTPTMNNQYKNAIVRASGYRYVDVDGLVRINNNGDWISGALDVDNVHPTVLGAKLIYHRFLSDLPEIMTK